MEHYGLPFQVRMLKTKYGCHAESLLWVTGKSCNHEWLLVENGHQIPSNPYIAHQAWEEIKPVDMQDDVKWLLLTAIAQAGRVNALRESWRAAASVGSCVFANKRSRWSCMYAEGW